MDFSTLYTVKNGHSGDICKIDIPVEYEADLRKGGLLFELFYENMPSRPQREFLSETIPTRTFPFFCLLQLVAGDGYFYDGETGKREILKPGDGLCIPPGFAHRYGGYALNFIEDSVCFSGPLADAFFKRGILRKGVFHFGRERRLSALFKLLRKPELASLFEAQSFLSELILTLYRENEIPEEKNREKSSIALLIQALQSDGKEWSVTAMAEYLQVSENYLRRLFLKETGVSPKKFLDRLWMSRATAAVCDQSAKLSYIAERLGNGDSAYFFRRFKKMTGLTPFEYRSIYSRDLALPECAGAGHGLRKRDQEGVF